MSEALFTAGTGGYKLLNLHSLRQGSLKPIAFPVRKRADIENAHFRARIQRFISMFSGDFLQSVKTALEQWWTFRPVEKAGLELILVHPDGQREKSVVYRRAIRIGRSPTCHVQLPSSTVSGEHCEIRVDEQGIWIIDLESTNGTRVNGVKIPSMKTEPLKPGDEVSIPPFRIVIGNKNIEFTPAELSLQVREVMWMKTEDPVSYLGLNDRLWARVRVGSWRGALGIPFGWVPFAYQMLDLTPPPVMELKNDCELDRAITGYLLQQVAQECSSVLGQDIGVSLPVNHPEIMEWFPSGIREWDWALFDVLTGPVVYEVPLFWPSQEYSGSKPSTIPNAIQDLTFPISVQCGTAVLPYKDFLALEQGFIILPDTWTLEPGDDPETHGQGTVILQVQEAVRLAQLRMEEQRCFLDIQNQWKYLPRGVVSVTNQELNEEPGEFELKPIRIPDDLHVTLVFELERIQVPLQGLAAWEVGQVVELVRSPGDPIHIILSQGSQSRVVGTGKIVDVEGRLGIQIETWTLQKGDT